MTIRHLRIFVAVAETGKMSAAAERCFLSQPTVSQAIRELEEHYQVRLFERLSKRLHITAAGEQLLVYANSVLSQFDVMEDNMADLCSASQLRIGASITVGATLLSPILKELKARFPELHTYSCVANTSRVESLLLESKLDVGLVEGVVSSPFLVSVPVADDYLVLAMAKDHPLADREQLRLEEVMNYEFVLREKGSGTRSQLEEYLRAHGVSCRVAMEATCLDAIKNAVVENGYLSAISLRLLEPEVRAGRIRVARGGGEEWNRHFYLVYHKDKFLTAPMRALEQIMAAYNRRDLLQGIQAAALAAE